MIRLTTILILAFPMLSTADDRLPQPDYHRQPGDPEWLASVVQFHGHLGPAVVAGARMGMIGLRAVEAKGYFDVEVTCEGPMAKPPQACFFGRGAGGHRSHDGQAFASLGASRSNPGASQEHPDRQDR